MAQKAIVNASYSPFPSPGVPNGDVLELMLDAKAVAANIDKINIQDVNTGTTRRVGIFRIVAGIVVIDNALAAFGFPAAPETLQQLFLRQPRFLSSNPLSVTILFTPKNATTPPVISSTQIDARIPTLRPQALDAEAPKGREDAEVYLAGESVTAVGSKPVFSADLKYDRPLIPLHTTSSTTLGPYFSYKGSTNPKADPDQLRAGLKLSGLIWYKGRDKGSSKDGAKACFLCFIQWEVTGEIEANRKFSVKNIITSNRLNFNFRTFTLSADKSKPVRDSVLFRFVPFLGADLGRNLSSPITRDERGIGRMIAGANLNLKIPAASLREIGIANGVLWENTFTQRWLVKPEMAYNKDKDGKLVLRNFGRRSRSHLTSKVSFLFSDFFGPTLAYEWGEQPPLYSRIRHQLKFGLTFFQKTKAPN